MAKCQVNNNWGLLSSVFFVLSSYFFVAEIVVLMGGFGSYVLSG